MNKHLDKIKEKLAREPWIDEQCPFCDVSIGEHSIIALTECSSALFFRNHFKGEQSS